MVAFGDYFHCTFFCFVKKEDNAHSVAPQAPFLSRAPFLTWRGTHTASTGNIS